MCVTMASTAAEPKATIANSKANTNCKLTAGVGFASGHRSMWGRVRQRLLDVP